MEASGGSLRLLRPGAVASLDDGPLLGRLAKRRSRLVVPLFSLSFSPFILTLLVQSYCPAVVSRQVVGSVNVAYLLALLQFLATFSIAVVYAWIAKRATGTLGGEVFVAFIAAVTFATIFAVVAGLLIAASSNIAYDLYTHVFRRNRDEQAEVTVAKYSTAVVGVAAILLALAVQSLNVAFLVGLAFAVAASANLPVILYSLFWRRFTATGAVLALLVGTGTAVASVLLGPAVIGAKGLILSSTAPPISLTNPGIISIPAGFAAGWLGSLFGKRQGRADELFNQFRLRALTGLGAEESATGH